MRLQAARSAGLLWSRALHTLQSLVNWCWFHSCLLQEEKVDLQRQRGEGLLPSSPSGQHGQHLPEALGILGALFPLLIPGGGQTGCDWEPRGPLFCWGSSASMSGAQEKPRSLLCGSVWLPGSDYRGPELPCRRQAPSPGHFSRGLVVCQTLGEKRRWNRSAAATGLYSF